jgi:hypothetical protein
MQSYRGIGCGLALLLAACGSASKPTSQAGQDAGLGPDLTGAARDTASTPATDAFNASDAWMAPVHDGATPDAWTASGGDAAPTPDAQVVTDARSSAELGPQVDAPGTNGDLPRVQDAASSVSATTTPDNDPTPQVCSTLRLGTQDFSSDRGYDIVMDDCLRVSGTVTLAGPLPDGATWSEGSVQLYKIIRDATGAVADTIHYAARITTIDDSHFNYVVGVPADSYELVVYLGVKSGAQLPSVATRIGQAQIAISQSIKHDITLPALDLVARTVTVTGTDALASNGNAFGRFLQVTGLNASHTLMVNGMSLSSGGTTSIAMWLPRETVSPLVLVQESPGYTAPYPSGFVSQFKLDDVSGNGDVSLAIPTAVKLSGTVSDPYQMLSPAMTIGTTGTSAISYYHCDPSDPGTFPNPIFNYPEGSTASFFSGATSYGFFARKGLACVPYAEYAIATGAPGATPTRDGENTFAFLQDPTARATGAVVLTTDLVRNVTVPDLGARVTITGTVKDRRGNGMANAILSFNSRSLAAATLADKTFVGSLNVGATGAYTARALPGSYDVSIALASESAPPPVPDAGAPPAKDAATSADVGMGGECSTLAACCSTLADANKILCQTAVSAATDLVCASYLTVFRQQGSCQ